MQALSTDGQGAKLPVNWGGGIRGTHRLVWVIWNTKLPFSLERDLISGSTIQSEKLVSSRLITGIL
jgi:hypothetical protein